MLSTLLITTFQLIVCKNRLPLVLGPWLVVLLTSLTEFLLYLEKLLPGWPPDLWCPPGLGLEVSLFSMYMPPLGSYNLQAQLSSMSHEPRWDGWSGLDVSGISKLTDTKSKFILIGLRTSSIQLGLGSLLTVKNSNHSLDRGLWLPFWGSWGKVCAIQFPPAQECNQNVCFNHLLTLKTSFKHLSLYRLTTVIPCAHRVQS